MTAYLCALAAGLAVALLLPARPSLVSGVPAVPGPAPGDPSSAESALRRWRLPLSVLAGSAALVVADGWLALVGAVLVGVVAWRVLSRSEPGEHAAERERAARDLPYLVLLLAAGLRAGAAPAPALARACAALPGPAAERLRPSAARLAVGAAPVEVWWEMAADPVLGPLGSALSRSAESGASVVEAVERLADDLAAEGRAGVEDRARTVGVRAAGPLGLCLLPAFLLLGIVPLVAALADGLMRR